MFVKLSGFAGLYSVDQKRQSNTLMNALLVRVLHQLDIS